LTEVIELFMYIVLWVVALITIVIFKEVFSSKTCKEYNEKIEELKEKVKEAEEALAKQRQYYETLLKDAAVKNTMMVALYNAWKKGELKKCYSEGGEVRILADGTLLCHKKEIEESYTIEVEEEETEEAEESERGKR